MFHAGLKIGPLFKPLVNALQVSSHTRKKISLRQISDAFNSDAFLNQAPTIHNGFERKTNLRIAEVALFLDAKNRLNLDEIKAACTSYRLAAIEGTSYFIDQKPETI